jgi:hypothetical protein
MEQQNNSSYIHTNEIKLDQFFFEEKSGLLNGLTYASAQYIYKVLERYGRDKIKWFDVVKAKKLRRTIIHKNAHLDEYFAELIFRAILPPYLKDIEVCEHVLMSDEDDSYAKLSWPNGVVFGIHKDEAGGAKALEFYDEHNSDGSRIRPSCSQLVAEEYFGNCIPKSIQKVLDEVNYSDSHSGAHQYNIKNLFFAIHDILFVVGKNEIDNSPVTKYLTENWKRAIIDSCLTAMVYAYENRLLPDKLDERQKESIEKVTKKSLDYFLSKSMLKELAPEHFEKIKGSLLFNFKAWDNREKDNRNWHKTIDGAVWKDDETGQVIGQQILILQIVCYALNKCWGEHLTNFIMMHIWQIIFQQQISFQEIKSEILKVTESETKGITKFGYIEKIVLNGLSFKPEQSDKDKRKRSINIDSPLWIYEASVTNPNYPNVKTVLGAIINDDYSAHGNNGFGVFILHDKTINSKLVNNGQTLPYEIWKKLSDRITESEPDRWFQLKANGVYADFLLNRNKAHQEQLPSDLIDMESIIETLKGLH